MAVHADNGFGDVGHVLADAPNQISELLGHRVAGGIRYVDHRGAGIDHSLEHDEEVGCIGAARVFGVKLDVVRVALGQLDRVHAQLQNARPLFLQRASVAFVAELTHDVDVGGADSGMDTRTRGFVQRRTAGLDIARDGARQGADDGTLNLPRDLPHGFKIVRRRSGVAGLDHVDIQAGKLSGHRQLVAAAQPRASGLFAIPQRGIEYRHQIGHRKLLDHQKRLVPPMLAKGAVIHACKVGQAIALCGLSQVRG